MSLHASGSAPVIVDEPVDTLEALVSALDHRIPGFRDQFDDSIFTFAVNDQMVLHGVRGHRLEDGDVVDIVPALAGG